MARALRTVGVSALVLVLAGAAYGTADAYDVVPGVLTLAPEPAPAAPFPDAPAAGTDPAGTAVLGDLDPGAPTPDPAQVAALLQALVTDPRVGPSVGAVVADELTGEVLAAHAPDQPRTPASTAKLVTAVAALQQLGPDRTFDTRVLQGPGDQLVLVGGGDMMLADGPGDPDAVNGRAGLADLAAQVATGLHLAGRDSVTLALDDSLFSGPAIAPGWDPADVGAGYAAPVAALGVDVGAMGEGEYPQRYPDPAMQATRQLAAQLAAQGITVRGEPTRVTGVTGDQVAVVHSAPLAEVVHHFLDLSDNTITEVVARMVAVDLGLPGSVDGGTQAVLRTVATLGVDTSGAHLADASGLAEGSALPPQLLLGLLRLVTDPAHPALREIGTGMPIGGLTGTLADRYTDGAATGLVRAKTGSLAGVTSLAGTVLDADGRQLLFVLMADQTGAVGQANPRAALDATVTALAGCGCR